MTLQTDPICGRIHPIFGLLMDGNDLNDEYDLKKDPYKPTTQLCTPKQSSSPKRELLDARYDPSKLKFHGKLEIKKELSYYGLHVFFVMPTSDGTMKNLILNYYLFELDDIIKEYGSRHIKPYPVLEDNISETQDSIQA